MFEERAQGGVGDALELEIVERLGQRHVAFQRDEFLRQPRHVGMFDEIVAQLACLHPLGGAKHRFKRAMF